MRLDLVSLHQNYSNRTDGNEITVAKIACSKPKELEVIPIPGKTDIIYLSTSVCPITDCPVMFKEA